MTKVDWADERFEWLRKRYNMLYIYSLALILLFGILWFDTDFQIKDLQDQMPKKVCENVDKEEEILVEANLKYNQSFEYVFSTVHDYKIKCPIILEDQTINGSCYSQDLYMDEEGNPFCSTFYISCRKIYQEMECHYE